MNWEVLTMRSATSYFKTLVRSDLRHYWPICFGYTFIWIALLPMVLMRDLHDMDSPRDYVVEMMGQAMFPSLIMAVIFGIIAAMACYSYLMGSRSTGLLHSLPAKRSTHFLAHFTSGMTMLLGGNVIVFVLVFLAQVSGMGSVKWDVTLLWLLTATLLDFVFFTLGIFCAMFTGWLLAVPVLYVGINFAAAVIQLLIGSLSGILYYGYCDVDLLPFVTWLTPIIKIGGKFKNIDYYAGSSVPNWQDDKDIMLLLLIYAAAALVLLGVSYLLYRRRHSEAAGDSVAFRWAKPVFRYLIAVVGGLALGMGLFWTVFDGGFVHSRVGLLVCLLLMTAICYFAAEMLICKSLRVFRQGWKGLLAACGIVVVLFAAMCLDLFGYVHYVPDAAQVKSVDVTIDAQSFAYGANCTDEETILAAINAQKAAIEQGRGEAEEDADCNALHLTYILKDGKEVRRSYTDMHLEKGSALHEALNVLGNMETVARQTLLRNASDWEIKQICGGCAYSSDGQCILTAEEARNIYQALERDVAANKGNWDAAKATVVDDSKYTTIELESVNGNYINLDQIPTYCKDTWKIINHLHFEQDW
ncbi:MAG: hypothetical protein Q3985_07870 [Eubacteriales bacterium]|nr:hypothetical protein [Eubacteriales bacterium]